MAVKKFLTLALIVNLVTSSIASQFIQDDILAFPRYKVVLTNEKISHSQYNKEIRELTPETRIGDTVIMFSSSGQPFSCLIPNVQIEKERLEREKEENSQEETEQDIERTIDRGLELLEPLGINCIRFFASTHQYWAYEYCHNQYVRQYHVERSHDGKVEREQETASFYLGIYPGSLDSIMPDDGNKKALAATNNMKPKKSNAKAPTTLRKVGDQRYLVQEWKNGSNCDLTDQPRTVEVQYHCDTQGQDRVSSFVEVSTCHYQIIVSTPRLCEEMNLSHRHHAESYKIECKPIVSDKLIEQEQQKQQQQQQQENQEEEKASEVSEEEEAVILAEEHIKKLLDKVVIEEEKGPRTKEEQDFLLSLISDLTEEVNRLKLQMSALPTDSSEQDKQKKPELSIFTFDANGNIVPGADLNQLIHSNEAVAVAAAAIEMKNRKEQEQQNNKAKDQHSNKQAYHQNYMAAGAAHY